MATEIAFQPKDEDVGLALAAIQSFAIDVGAYQQGLSFTEQQVDDLERVCDRLRSCRLEGGAGPEVLAAVARLLQLGYENATEEKADLEEELKEKDRRLLELERGSDDGAVRLLREDMKEAQSRMAVLENENALLVEREAEWNANKERMQLLHEEKLAADQLLQEAQAAVERMRLEREALESRVQELDGELQFEREQARRRRQDKSDNKHQEERLFRDTEALMRRVEDLDAKNTQLSEDYDESCKCVLQQQRELDALNRANAELSLRAEELETARTGMQEEVLRLRDELRDKLELLDEFQVKFTKQFSSWEHERVSLQRQIDTLQQQVSLGQPGPASGGWPSPGGLGAADGAAAAGEEAAGLRQQVGELEDEKILLLEAYEQLEQDQGRELDRHTEQLRAELQRLETQLQQQGDELRRERVASRALQGENEKQARLLSEAERDAHRLTSGQLGLPEAVEEIKALKSQRAELSGVNERLGQDVADREELIQQLRDENGQLRRAAGAAARSVQPTEMKHVQLTRERRLMQLEALNAHLESEVADLEEERRKLRWEIKLRAKYHGAQALTLGLSPEQMLLLEQYAEALRDGGSAAKQLDRGDGQLVEVVGATVVAQLQKRVHFLEGRLAEAAASGALPLRMQQELWPSLLPQLRQAAARVADARAQLQGLEAALPQQQRGDRGTRQRSLQDMDAQLGVALDSFAELETAMADVASTAAAPASALRLAAAPAAESSCGLDLAVPLPERQPSFALATADIAAAPSGLLLPVPTDALIPAGGSKVGAGGLLAAAAADALREKLSAVMKQLVDHQVDLEQKEQELVRLRQQHGLLQKRLGVAAADVSEELAGEGAVALADPAAAREMQLENAALKQQLVEALEEAQVRDAQLKQAAGDLERQQGRMEALFDTRNMLYRDHARAVAESRSLEGALRRKMNKLEEENAGLARANEELQRGLTAVQAASGGDALRAEHVDTVRRMAVVQVKHAKVARQMQHLVASEKVLQEGKEELEWDLRELSATMRSRLQWLERSKAELARRVDRLHRDLEASVPAQLHHALLERYSTVQAQCRRLLEQGPDSVVEASELLQLREDVARLHQMYCKACEDAAGWQERCQTAEDAASKAGVSLEGDWRNQAVEREVQLEGARRQLELTVREKERGAASLQEAQQEAGSLRESLAKQAAELAGLRESERLLRHRLEGCRPAEEVAGLQQRLAVAEEESMRCRQEAETLRSAQQDVQAIEEAHKWERRRLMAELTNLRAALRELSGKSDVHARFGGLVAEADQLRGKEAVARARLNRSEAEKHVLREQLLTATQQVAVLQREVAQLQDKCGFRSQQQHDMWLQLETVAAGKTDSWKTSLWQLKIFTLKSSNDAIMSGLDASRQQVSGLEQQLAAAQAALEAATDIQELLSQPMSEVHQAAAASRQEMMALRMDTAKLQREQLLLREKARFLEKVNAELHLRMEDYEREHAEQLKALEGEQQLQQDRGMQLQQQLYAVQQELDKTAAELAESRAQLAKTRRTMACGAGAGELEAALGQKPVRPVTDADALVKQIEATAQARKEAETYRLQLEERDRQQQELQMQYQELKRMHEDALQRMQPYASESSGPGADGEGDEATWAQMKLVAEATVAQLTERLAQRERELQQLRQKLEDSRATFLAQHERDRQEIERLNQKLYEHNTSAIHALRDALNRPSCKAAGGEDGKASYEELEFHIERLGKEKEVLSSTINSKDAEREALQQQQAKELAAKDRVIEQLKEDIQLAKDMSPSAELERKLRGQLATKDGRLKQLREAIKVLEGKLVEAMKKNADDAIKASSWHEQRRQDEQITALDAAKGQLAAELEATRQQAAGMQARLDEEERVLQHARDELAAEKAQSQVVREQLASARQELGQLRAARRQAADLNAALSAQPENSTQELEKRVQVLEAQNARLKKLVQREDAQATAAAGAARPESPPGSRAVTPADVVLEERSNRGQDPVRSAAGAELRGVATDSAAAPAVDASDSLRSAKQAALQAWEEQKKLQKRVELLQGKLKARGEEVRKAESERERLQVQLQKQAAQLKQAGAEAQQLRAAVQQQRSAQDAAARLALGSPEVQKLVQKLGEAERQVDELQLALAALQRQQPERSNAGGGGGKEVLQDAGERAALEAKLFEAQLGRDQAFIRAQRVEQRLLQLLGPHADAPAPATAGSARGSAAASSTGRGPQAGLAAERRINDLQDTIALLQKALERAHRESASSVPSSKYMLVVEKRKALQKEVSDMSAEIAESQAVRQECRRLEAQAHELQSANLQLTRRAEAAEHRLQLQPAHPGDASAATAEVQSLIAQIASRDAEIRELRSALRDREADLQTSARPMVLEGHEAQEELRALREALQQLEAENSALKNELNAFDPAFFEEIEDLKHDRHQLAKRVAQHEATIRHLAQQLGLPPPL